MEQKVLIENNAVTPDSSMRELLCYLDSLLNTGGTVAVDVRGTDMEFVERMSCVHCGRGIRVWLPMRLVGKDAAMRCFRCEDTVAHASDSEVSYYRTVTRYTLHSSEKLLNTSLKTLGFADTSGIRVCDADGTLYEVFLGTQGR